MHLIEVHEQPINSFQPRDMLSFINLSVNYDSFITNIAIQKRDGICEVLHRIQMRKIFSYEPHRFGNIMGLLYMYHLIILKMPISGVKSMNITVRSIEKCEMAYHYIVTIVIGKEHHVCVFAAQPIPDEDQPIVVIKGDTIFNRLFQYSPDRRIDMYKLIRRLYDGEILILPLELGEYGV